MKKLSLLLSLFVAVIFTAGCGGAVGYKSIKAGNMPQDGTWDGVYHSQAYGRMELTANGSMVYGLYEAERWRGKIEGESDGNILNFMWTQWGEDLNGKVRETRGHGYFVYTSKDEGTAEKPRVTHFIDGEWGYGENNSGNKWNAVKFPAGTKKILKTDGAVDADKPAANADPFSNSSPSSPAQSGGGLDSSGNGDLSSDVDDLF